MSVVYGYDLKGGDKILEAPVQLTKLMSRLLSPGRALVNYLPFCAVLNFVHTSHTSQLFFSEIHSFMCTVLQL
jgi:hypothetical protein